MFPGKKRSKLRKVERGLIIVSVLQTDNRIWYSSSGPNQFGRKPIAIVHAIKKNPITSTPIFDIGKDPRKTAIEVNNPMKKIDININPIKPSKGSDDHPSRIKIEIPVGIKTSNQINKLDKKIVIK